MIVNSYPNRKPKGKDKGMRVCDRCHYNCLHPESMARHIERTGHQ